MLWWLLAVLIVAVIALYLLRERRGPGSDPEVESALLGDDPKEVDEGPDATSRFGRRDAPDVHRPVEPHRTAPAADDDAPWTEADRPGAQSGYPVRPAQPAHGAAPEADPPVHRPPADRGTPPRPLPHPGDPDTAGRQPPAGANPPPHPRANAALTQLAHALDIHTPRTEAARQSLTEAADRHRVATFLLARARTPADAEHAEHTAREGLHYIRAARVAMNMSPGPDLPPLEGQPEAGRVTERRTVTFSGRRIDISPSPSAVTPHHHPGGRIADRPVPAGWYSEPWWRPAMAAGAWGAGSQFLFAALFSGMPGVPYTAEQFEHGLDTWNNDPYAESAGFNGGGHNGTGYTPEKHSAETGPDRPATPTPEHDTADRPDEPPSNTTHRAPEPPPHRTETPDAAAHPGPTTAGGTDPDTPPSPNHPGHTPPPQEPPLPRRTTPPPPIHQHPNDPDLPTPDLGEGLPRDTTPTPDPPTAYSDPDYQASGYGTPTPSPGNNGIEYNGTRHNGHSLNGHRGFDDTGGYESGGYDPGGLDTPY